MKMGNKFIMFGLAVSSAVAVATTVALNANAGDNSVKLNTKVGKVTATKVKEEKSAVFTVFRYKITDKERGIELKAPLYRIKTKDGKELYFVSAYKLENGTLVPVKDYNVEQIPINVSFLEKINKQLRKFGVNNRIGNPKNPKMYVIFDAFCPFCIKSFKTHCASLAEKYNIYLIPFAVHGEKSVNALTCILDAAKEKNIHDVLAKFFGSFNGDWNTYEKLFPPCAQSDKKMAEFVKNTASVLLEHGIDATPTFVVEKNGKFYVYVGEPPKGGEK